MNEEQTLSNSNQEVKVDGWTRSWHIFRSSWRILMLDKEILLVPLVAGVISLIIALVGFIGGYIVGQDSNTANFINYAKQGNSNGLTYTTYAAWIATSAALALIATYTLAAVVSITLDRLRGQDPTVRSGLAQVKRKLGSLTAFGLLSFGVVQMLQIIEERVPFIGARIIGFLGETAWRIAAFFAVPVIIDSKDKVGPVSATKQSLDIIRRTWREAAGSQFGVGFVIFLVVMVEILVGLMSGFLAYAVAGSAGAVSIGLFFGFAVLATMLVSSTVTGIAKAALYYYAATGKVPEQFNSELFRQAFTKRKARKIFA